MSAAGLCESKMLLCLSQERKSVMKNHSAGTTLLKHASHLLSIKFEDVIRHIETSKVLQITV